MKRPTHALAVALLVMVVGVAAWRLLFASRVTASLASPDGRLRAVLLDRRTWYIDRNFVVRIEESDGTSRTVFRSPDEPPTGIGSERFLWSSDSTRLLLVGRDFWAREDAELATGEFLYLLCDVPSGQVWCNSEQRGPPFGPDDLSGYDFGEDLRLKPGPTGSQ